MYKLLVADDAGFIREIVRSAFENTEFKIVGEAIDGNDAVERASTLKPDVILMDMVMPNKNGVEAAKEILKENPKCRIVAFSSVDQQSVVLNAIEAGCCSFIAKPFRVEELLAVVRKSVKES